MIKQPEPVASWHLLPVPNTLRVDGYFPKARRFRRLHASRGGPSRTSKRGGHDYGDLHAFSVTAQTGGPSEKEKGAKQGLGYWRGHRRYSVSYGGIIKRSDSAEGARGKSAATGDCETLAQSQEVEDPERKVVRTRLQFRLPTHTLSATP